MSGTHFPLKVTHASQDVSVDVYEVKPKTPPRGGMICVQEIFGVTEHIRNVTERYAEMGFVSWAPAFFDVVAERVDLPYNGESMAKGMQIAGQLGWDWPIETVRACAREFALKYPGLPLALVGYCWGGSVAWLSATRIEPGSALKATVGYYGSKAPEFKAETPQLPVMLHFGSKDKHITMDKVAALENAQPQVPIEIYDADHGFNRDGSASYDAEAARLALDKTMAFLVRNGF